jgi:uncharacterized paraquat-inducible protein A
MKKLTLVLLVLALAFIVTDVAAQCPMCKTSLEEARKNGSEVGSTLNNGILYLLALPYTIAMVFGFIYWRNRKQKAA